MKQINWERRASETIVQNTALCTVMFAAVIGAVELDALFDKSPSSLTPETETIQQVVTQRPSDSARAFEVEVLSEAFTDALNATVEDGEPFKVEVYDRRVAPSSPSVPDGMN